MENQILEYIAQIENATKQLDNLDIQYKNKKKTSGYYRSRESLLKKIPSLVKKIEQLGTIGNLLEITFRYNKPEEFELFSGKMYLTNLNVQNVLTLFLQLKKYRGILIDTVKVREILLGTIINI